MPTDTYTGVLDRFEEDLAVILLEADGEVVDEIVVDRGELPDDAAHPNAVLEVTLSDGEVTALEYDGDESADRQDRAQSRFDRLAKQPPKDNDSS